jgi:hypothetical protein
LTYKSRDKKHACLIEKMRDAVKHQSMQTLIEKEYFKETVGCRIPLLRRPDIRIKEYGKDYYF